jgi:hypothetical protein
MARCQHFIIGTQSRGQEPNPYHQVAQTIRRGGPESIPDRRVTLDVLVSRR